MLRSDNENLKSEAYRPSTTSTHTKDIEHTSFLDTLNRDPQGKDPEITDL